LSYDAGMGMNTLITSGFHLIITVFSILIVTQVMSINLSYSNEHSDMQVMMGPNSLWQSRSDCGEMAVWDVSMVMCMPIALADMSMTMLMVRGNGFANRAWQSGSRGRIDSFSTNMAMLDLGTTVGANHYLNIDLMLTTELWSVPRRGYPLLAQIGESDQSGAPYIDAQHPHSSPIMGLTFSDTIRLNEDKDFLKVFIAPRGESTDGPIAFMHRLTGIVNPNAPLGHHVGQDVGHISGSLIGGTLKLGQDRFEASIFSGAEPNPSQVDLPLERPDSFSLRYIRELGENGLFMMSFANLNDHHSSDQDHIKQRRYSLSHYYQAHFSENWSIYHSFIYGGVSEYDEIPFLSSISDEFLVKGHSNRFWGRFEALQRTPDQLMIKNQISSHERSWVYAFTLGYSRNLVSWEGAELNMGGLWTQSVLPQVFRSSYGGNPFSAQVFIQLGGMHMWDIAKK